MDHSLLPILVASARGIFPKDDGAFHVVPPLPDGRYAVVCFTGCAYVCASESFDRLASLGCDGFGGALRPQLLLHLAGPQGRVHEIDVTLAALGQGRDPYALPPELGDSRHPRVAYARSQRRDVCVHGDERGLITLAKGLAGRDEISIETPEVAFGKGGGRSLLRDVLAAWPEGQPLFAAVSPGNARSLRAFLAAGFRPVASEVLIERSSG
ncbi:hypothetical protein C1704_10360 [Caldimonas caldifontis]|uniref:Uncharacterized protein n=1 Tax=Caldimonas caldifontis TaxID=1452508 RepID=A0A2S5SUJ7_9BURK|nr:hypothetical protein C1704_10360 [Caldimonas caldifontis]